MLVAVIVVIAQLLLLVADWYIVVRETLTPAAILLSRQGSSWPACPRVERGLLSCPPVTCGSCVRPSSAASPQHLPWFVLPSASLRAFAGSPAWCELGGYSTGAAFPVVPALPDPPPATLSPFRTVLVGYEVEALWHEWFLLARSGRASWIILAPDGDMYEENLEGAHCFRVCGPQRQLHRGIRPGGSYRFGWGVVRGG